MARRHLRTWWLAAVILALPSCLPPFCAFHGFHTGPRPPGSAGVLPMAPEGHQVWTFGGSPHDIAATYYVVLHHERPSLMYCIAVRVPYVPRGAVADREAYPYMRYAWRSKRYARSEVTGLGGKLQVSRIGVAFFRQEGTHRWGWREAKSLKEIAALAGGDGGPGPAPGHPSPSPSGPPSP